MSVTNHKEDPDPTTGFIISLLKWFGVWSFSPILFSYCYLYRSKNNTSHRTKIIWMISENICLKVLMRQVCLNPFYLLWARILFFDAANIPSSKKHHKPAHHFLEGWLSPSLQLGHVSFTGLRRTNQSVLPAPVKCTLLKVFIGWRWHEVKL